MFAIKRFIPEKIVKEENEELENEEESEEEIEENLTTPALFLKDEKKDEKIKKDEKFEEMIEFFKSKNELEDEKKELLEIRLDTKTIEEKPKEEPTEEVVDLLDEEFDEKRGNVWIMSEQTIEIQKAALSNPLVEGLKSMGISKLFPVQRAVVPVTLALHQSFITGDLLVGSPTGSGKTLAYVLPILESILKTESSKLRALVIVPTFNLVEQVNQVFNSFKKFTKKTCVGFSKATHEREVKEIIGIRKGEDGEEKYFSLVDIIVSTPKKVLNHIRNTKGFTLEHLEFLVIDESDKLLSDPTEFDIIKEICSKKSKISNDFVPIQKPFLSTRKIILSATLKNNPSKIYELNLNRPQYFTYVPRESKIKYALPSKLKQYYVVCPITERGFYLMEIVKLYPKILIFCRTNTEVHLVHLLLKRMDFESFEILTKDDIKERDKNLTKFKKVEKGILISSDKISRGTDFSDVHCVINYDQPKKLKSYIHRIGRTARKEQEGFAYTLIEEDNLEAFKKKLTKVKGFPIEEFVIDPKILQNKEFAELEKEVYKEVDRKRREYVPKKDPIQIEQERKEKEEEELRKLFAEERRKHRLIRKLHKQGHVKKKKMKF